MSLVLSKWLDDFFEQELPSGLTNGVNDTFTLTFSPRSSSSVVLTLDGLILAQGVDYTITDKTITFVTPPVLGQIIYALYIKG